MTLLKLTELSFSYEDHPVLEDLDFSIPEGDFLGILGPNGSGKTTLLRLMSGALSPSRGKVELLGRPLRDYSARQRARRLAVVPQDFDVLFPFTALEVVLMGRWSYLKPFSWESEGDLRLARQAMAETDCLQFENRPVTELSGGERERVLIARALAQGPKVFMLDEPTTHLDLEHQVKTYNLLLRLNRERGMTLVMTLHDLNFAARACKRVLLLKGGKLICLGPPEQVMQHQTLQEVFHTKLFEEIHPQTGKPFYLPDVGG